MRTGASLQSQLALSCNNTRVLAHTQQCFLREIPYLSRDETKEGACERKLKWVLSEVGVFLAKTELDREGPQAAIRWCHPCQHDLIVRPPKALRAAMICSSALSAGSTLLRG